MGGFHLFTLADIPVRISPWYVFLLAFLMTGNGDPAIGLVLAICITVSLLAHELGHALVARHFKLRPEILLHGLGGLTGHERARSDGQDALIIAAGPMAGFMLGAASLLALSFLPIESQGLQFFLYQLVRWNFFWSAFNLLPMWPMDGGQLLRIGASKLFPPMLVHLVASGETSGELEAMLERAADNQERELDGVVNTAVGILGPVMILLMGGFVFVIVVALLLPIFQLNQAVR